jgi:predicted RND superfamily exporter protein
MSRFARWLALQPWIVLVGSFLLTVWLGSYAWQIRIESALDTVLPRGDPAVEYYDQIRATFGSDDVGVVGVLAPDGPADILAPATLEKIHRLSTDLGKIHGVEHVYSLTTVVDITAATSGVAPPKLLPKIPPDPDDVKALRATLDAMPFYRKNLISNDYRGTAITIFFKTLSDADYERTAVDDQIMAVLDRQPGPERLFFTSASHIKQEAVKLMRRDLYRFIPLSLLVVVVTLWLSFRTKRGVLMPLLSVITALVWTLGIMVLTGHTITLGTFVLPGLILVVGSSYAIHVMARYYEQTESHTDRIEAVVRAFDRVWVPLLISALTTAIGFGALMVNRIPAIFELGAFAVVGVVCLAVTTLLPLPASLAILPIERVAQRARGGAPVLGRLLSRLAWAASALRQPILWGAMLVAGVSILMIRQIQVDADFLYYFAPNTRVRIDNETINERIVGSNPFYVVIDGEPGTIKRWEVLKLIKDLQAHLEAQPGITTTASIVDVLELLETGVRRTTGDLEVNDAGEIVRAEPPKSFWEVPANLDPLLKLVGTNTETIKSTVTPDFAKASILVRTKLSGSRSIEQTLNGVRAYIAQHFPKDLPVRLTGTLVLLTGTTSDIVAGQIESLTIALGVIFVVMSAMFLSTRIGLLAILPNVLPILIFFGVMAQLGILLNLGTSLIAAISLGIAVDSTVHYMARLNLELKGETDQGAAITRALRTVGVPIVYTTIALFFGFLTFAFSSFVPIQDFGILAGTTMATSLVANLVLLPAVLGTTKIITLWDLVGVKLGEDPARTIPLFAGLRPSQARVVVLMGEAKRFRAGEFVVQTGEPGEEMYVILEGKVEVWAGHGASRRKLTELKRGDVFGEMGFVRRSERTADVVSATDVELLAVDQRFLERVQRRYPRIASKVFLNLTRLLSNSLERTTQQVVAAARAQQA